MQITIKLCSLVLLLAFSSAGQTQTGKLGWPGETLSGNPCYGHDSGYGPYNYVTQRSKVGIVEQYHFTPVVEQLKSGQSGGIDSDIDYTLRAIPNHHRALWAVARLYFRKMRALSNHERVDQERAQRGYPPPECYLQRAALFARNDGIVRQIYGTYLHRVGELDLALEQYRAAEKILPEHAELAYNIGLLHVERQELAEAQDYTEKAASLGYPLQGLKRKTERLARELAGSGHDAQTPK